MYVIIHLRALARGTMVKRSVFPALLRICASSLWGKFTTDLPSTASRRSPGLIWPLHAAGLPLRTVTNLWGSRDTAAEQRDKRHSFNVLSVDCTKLATAILHYVEMQERLVVCCYVWLGYCLVVYFIRKSIIISLIHCPFNEYIDETD